MSAWVMVIFVSMSFRAVAIDHIPFASQEACEAAKPAIIATMQADSLRSGAAVCVRRAP